MADSRIPDDIERWEKRGLREDIDTDREHVHDIYVWKNLAVEHEVFEDCDCRGHWNPYAIVDGHPMKLSKDYFDSFEEAVGFLKACMKNKKLVGADESDESDGREDMGIPKHPEGDTVARKSVSMQTRIAFMSGEEGALERYRAELADIRKGSDGNTALDADKQGHAIEMARQGWSRPGGKPLNQTEEPGKSPSGEHGDAVNHPKGGKEGTPVSKVPVGGNPDAPVNGERKVSGYTKNPNANANTITGKIASAPTAGAAQNLGKKLDDLAPGSTRGDRIEFAGKEQYAGQGARPEFKDIGMVLGTDSFPTTGANKFMSHSFVKPKFYLGMMNSYNQNARNMRSELMPIVDEDRDLTSEDFSKLSAHQLRQMLMQEYKEKDPLTGQLVHPKELKNVPIFGGWMLNQKNDDGTFVQPVGPDGTLNQKVFTMLANQDDTLGGGNGILPNSLGIYNTKLGGQISNRPAADIAGREDELTHVYGKDRLPTLNMIMGTLAQATNKLNRDRKEISDEDVENTISDFFTDERFTDPSQIARVLRPYMTDGDGNPMDEAGAKRLWAIDRIMRDRQDKEAGAIEPYMMHYLDNVPLGQLMQLFEKYPYFRRNAALTDEERRNWYRDLFSQAAIRDYQYEPTADPAWGAVTSEDPFENWKKYVGAFGGGYGGRTQQEMRDDAEFAATGGRGESAGPGVKPSADGSPKPPSVDASLEGGGPVDEKTADEMKKLVENTHSGNIIATDKDKVEDSNSKYERKMKRNAQRASMADRIAGFDSTFDIVKGEEESVELPEGKHDTNPRIASFRTVSMGEGKESPFPMRVVDRTTGKVLFEWDGRQ